MDLQLFDSLRQEVLNAIYPLQTEMDLNIGFILKVSSQSGKCNSKILLSGSGADEIFGGYARYKNLYRKNEIEEMECEMKKDQKIYWQKNISRDDRVISSSGKELRTPFIIQSLWKFANRLPLQFLFGDLNNLQEKFILRKLSEAYGLQVAAVAPKRALQFGSGIAKSVNLRDYGTCRIGKGDSIKGV